MPFFALTEIATLKNARVTRDNDEERKVRNVTAPGGYWEDKISQVFITFIETI